MTDPEKLNKLDAAIIQEKLSKLDPALIRVLKQIFVSHKLIPMKFSFILPNVGKFEVECIYPEGQYGQMNIRVI